MALFPAAYAAVKVLMICWEHPDEREFETQLKALEKELREYKFDVDPPFKIPTKNPQRQLDQRMHKFLEYESDETLLVIYYGGHGINNQDKNHMWLRDFAETASEIAKTPKVNWSAVQSLFLDEGESHVLLLLDDCYAGSIVQWTEASNHVEAIVATGFDGVAPIRGKDSFTRALTDTLKQCRIEETVISIARLSSLVAARLNQTEWRVEKGSSLRVTPQHLTFSNNNHTIRIQVIATNSEHSDSHAIPVTGRTRSKENVEESDGHGPPEHGSRLIRPAMPPSRRTTITSGTQVDVVALPGLGLSPQLRHSRPVSPQPPSFRIEKRSLIPGAIGLMHLYASQGYTDPISFSITPHDISSIRDDIQYIAISYMWGDTSLEKSKAQLHVDKSMNTLAITPSLEQALRRIRKRREEVLVWVDEICVNQDDFVEKTRTIDLMPEIFRKAAHGMIWLGIGNGECEMAMDLIPRLVNLDELDDLIKSDEMPARWRAVVKLLENPVFSRRWKLYEFMLGKHAFVYCGDRVVSWDDFCDAITTLGSRYDEIQALCKRRSIAHGSESELDNLVDLRALPAYSVVDATRDLFRRSDNDTISSMCNLHTLVSYLPGLQSHGAHDVIFALLPVASDRELWAKDARYNGAGYRYRISAMELYGYFVRFCAKTTMSIDIICTPWAPKRVKGYGGDTPGSSFTEPDRASWICHVDRLPFGKFGNGYGRRNGEVFVGRPGRRFYNAARGSDAVPVFGGSFSTGQVVSRGPRYSVEETMFDGSMLVSGFKIGSIEELGNRAAAGTLHAEWIEMSGWQTGSTSVPDHFWRTLVADRGPNGIPTPTWYHRACLYWLDLFEGEDINYDVWQQRRYPSAALQYIQRVQTVIWNRKLFAVKDRRGKRLLGLAPPQTKIGDCVAVLHGCSVPVILRETVSSQPGDVWNLIGECFVYGIMEGEAMQIEENKSNTQEFLLR